MWKTKRVEGDGTDNNSTRANEEWSKSGIKLKETLRMIVKTKFKKKEKYIKIDRTLGHVTWLGEGNK